MEWLSQSAMPFENISSNLSSGQCASIDEFRNHVYSTAYSVITACGLAGNGFALLVLLRTWRQRSTFAVYMLNLVVSDLLCVSTLPLRVLYYANGGQWAYGDFLCRISTYALYVNLYCSIFFMTAVSCSRFLAVAFPVWNLQLAGVSRACAVCVCIWVFICLTSSPFLMSGTHLDPATNKTKCFEPPGDKMLHKLVVLNYFSLVVGFAIPFLVILLCYTGIVFTLLRGPSHLGKQRAARVKAIRLIAVVMLTFLVSFLPYHIQRTVHLHLLGRGDATCEEVVYMQKSVVVTLSLAAANSCFDPMLYFFSGESFRSRLSLVRKMSHKTSLRLRPMYVINGQPPTGRGQQHGNGVPHSSHERALCCQGEGRPLNDLD